MKKEQKLISRKICVVEKYFNLHTDFIYISELFFKVSMSVIKVKYNNKSGINYIHCQKTCNSNSSEITAVTVPHFLVMTVLPLMRPK